MDRDATLAALVGICTPGLGAGLAESFVALGRPGYDLVRAETGAATGKCRFGGHPLLAPGTPWPELEGHPLTFLAVLDTDALPWLEGTVPPATGLLNFFYLDSDSEDCDPAAHGLALKYMPDEPETSAVIRAAASEAVETVAPERASVFAPVPWRAVPGIAFPDSWDPAWNTLDLRDHEDYHVRSLPSLYMLDLVGKWDERPGALDSDDIAFGRPAFPTGSSPTFPDGEDANAYTHLLQLSGKDDWWIGGDGGTMHWSIPTEALSAGDFTRAIPTPDIY